MINNKRKEILKKGIDVTLYPLPFRKGGKIMNAGLGDKTIQPGIEYGNGGGLPKINDLGKATVKQDATRMNSPIRPTGTPNPQAQRALTQPQVGPMKASPGVTAPRYGGGGARRATSKFNLGGVMNGGGGGGDKKVNFVSKFGDTTYAAPEKELDLPVVNRYGLPFYRLGRTEFQMMPGVEYPQLSTLQGASGTETLPNVAPKITYPNQQAGAVPPQAGLGQRRSKFGR